jgi:hypothetical protein
MEELLLLLKPLIEMYAGHLGPVVQLVALIGSARLILKPLQPLEKVIKEVIAATPTQRDDELLAKAEGSKVVKFAKFLIDYLLSVKLK